MRSALTPHPRGGARGSELALLTALTSDGTGTLGPPAQLGPTTAFSPLFTGQPGPEAAQAVQQGKTLVSPKFPSETLLPNRKASGDGASGGNDV